ncbi:hypothetical protein N7533_002839, partial [Penicillium manginii]|uniref:uncharacterized protein n=1 Tax=Penicillium manginii TaxID=203109 RepID=UPI002549A1A5
VVLWVLEPPDVNSTFLGHVRRIIYTQPHRPTSSSIIGLVVEFVVAIDEARVRFTDDAQIFFLLGFAWLQTEVSIIGLVVEFVVAIDEARVRFTDDAQDLTSSSFFMF